MKGLGRSQTSSSNSNSSNSSSWRSVLFVVTSSSPASTCSYSSSSSSSSSSHHHRDVSNHHGHVGRENMHSLLNNGEHCLQQMENFEMVLNFSKKFTVGELMQVSGQSIYFRLCNTDAAIAYNNKSSVGGALYLILFHANLPIPALIAA
nr:hypothetical protein [Tanacetum cinerariifolium]